MQSVDISPVLASFGGKLVTDSDGSYWRFNVEPFILDVEPFNSGPSWGFDCSLEHREFSVLANRVAGEPKNTFVCLHWFQVIQKSGETLEQLIREALSSASSKSLSAYVEELKSYIPEKSVPQVCHLAALALDGDFLKLMEYQEVFKSGRRLGFVPVITSTMIDRATDIALAGL